MFEPTWKRMVRTSPSWFRSNVPAWDIFLNDHINQWGHSPREINDSARMFFFGNAAFYVARLVNDWGKAEIEQIRNDTERAASRISSRLTSTILAARRGILADLLLEAAYDGNIPAGNPSVRRDPQIAEEAPVVPRGGDSSIALAAFLFQTAGTRPFLLKQVSDDFHVTKVLVSDYGNGAAFDRTLYFNLEGSPIDRNRLDLALTASLGS